MKIFSPGYVLPMRAHSLILHTRINNYDDSGPTKISIGSTKENIFQVLRFQFVQLWVLGRSQTTCIQTGKYA
uniref:Uncharacterized protein n=1 Tax=Trichogramma kaykai TaxID=54128 RepID=A0ABD2W2F9_9HYME